jgi:UDP-glucose 6-dehydrogenase
MHTNDTRMRETNIQITNQAQYHNNPHQELRDALNSKWNVEILEPREGIGGHCLPKDTKMFLQSSNGRKSKILRATTDVDEEYKRFRAKLEKEFNSAIIEGIESPKGKFL